MQEPHLISSPVSTDPARAPRSVHWPDYGELLVRAGKLTLRDADGVEQIAAVSEGVLKMEHGEALVLVDTIERPEEIDLHRAEEMAAEARAELKAKRSAQEQAIANARIARAISRIHVKHDGK